MDAYKEKKSFRMLLSIQNIYIFISLALTQRQSSANKFTKKGLILDYVQLGTGGKRGKEGSGSLSATATTVRKRDPVDFWTEIHNSYLHDYLVCTLNFNSRKEDLNFFY